MHHLELRTTLLGKGSYGRAAAPYKLLEVVGPEALEFLQRLCTQDLVGLAEGPVVPAGFLDAKGKLQFTVLVFRRGESFWLETHAELWERLYELLERYHFTEKLAIHRREFGAAYEAVCAADGAALTGACEWPTEGAGPVVKVTRRGVCFTRTHGGSPELGDAELTDELAEAARMLAGLVRVGVETEASTLALEADLDDHCSTSKGCYTGQEIVARIHTYGHVNRKLCLLRLPAGDAIAAPVALHEVEDDLPVGRVMHAVAVAGQDMRLGLGYLPQDFQAIGTGLTLAGDGDVEVIGFDALPVDQPAASEAPAEDPPPA